MNPPLDTTITLNGRPYPLSAPVSLPELLDQLGWLGKPVVVELNAEALPASLHHETTIRPGDRMEVVTLAAGG